MTVLSRRGAGAVLALGAAAWLSTFVFDRVGTGAGTRVALVSSWQEWVGLTVLAFLVVLLGKGLVERGLEDVGGEKAIPRTLLLPIAALAVLALPYLPFAADTVPALDALAGPGRWWVWAIVGVQLARAIGTLVIDAGRRLELPAATRQALIVAAGVAIFGTAAWRLQLTPVFPSGDEPHYLVVTQSLLADHDLAIENNHSRGDYRAYFPAPLKPDYRRRGSDGQIYSIHPVGVSVLIAPAFAIGGYRGASFFLAVLAACAAAMAWRWARAEKTSDGAAFFGWLAVVTSVPYVLHSFAIFPECAAAFALIAGLRPRDVFRLSRPLADAILRGVALGALPWLSTKYAPMSLVALALVWWAERERRAAIVLPYAASVGLWFGFFWWIYGTPSPAAPYGPAHQMTLANLTAGLPGLFADQEYGLLASAPVLALSVVGWWRLWRRDAAGRWTTLTTLVPFGILALTTGAFELWWGGTAPPGRELVAALPLLAVPLAWAWQSSEDAPVQRASLEWLAAVGIAMTCALVFVHDGQLAANTRDGASALLEYLDPARVLVRAVPSFALDRASLTTPALLALLWVAVAAAAWRAARVFDVSTRGGAQLAASALGAAGLLIVAMAAPVLARGDTTPSVPVESRVSAEVLDRYDERARPVAVVYAPFQVVSPEAALSDVVFAAEPGGRTAPQPIRVMFNTRLSLPAGRYRIVATPAHGATLSGDLGVQVGRRGPPLLEWALSPASPSTEFALDLDAGFVGFVAAPDVESRIARLDLTPLDVVDAGRRAPRPPVIAATREDGLTLYFHDDRTYVETDGFWTKGRTTVDLTLARSAPSRLPAAGVRLRIRGNTRSETPVTLVTPAWSTHVTVQPGQPVDVTVPWRADVAILPLAVTVDSGFVPAQEGGDPGDVRSLGCFVQIVGLTDAIVPAHAEVR
jgi:hypothetical protein